jgi:beta-N-acetylhexosaminidase
MLLAGIAGLDLSPREREQLRAREVSGVVLFARNFRSRAQLCELISELRQVRADAGFVIGVDQEGGPVQRFRAGFTRLPALARLGAQWERDPSHAVMSAEEHAWLMASELRALDIDVSFAPVLDLARGNRAIGTRALHADPDVVGELGQAYVRGMHLAGMAATAKHFPGHGSVRADTHREAAVDVRSLDTLRRLDLRPFIEAMAAGVEAMMMAHVIYPAVDAHPAGQSRTWIGDVLRSELNFSGLVLSDDISMAAASASGDVAARIRAHRAAGCDLILACQPEVVDAALAAASCLPACDPERVARLRGAAAGDWAALADNPQHAQIAARVTALDAPDRGDAPPRA